MGGWGDAAQAEAVKKAEAERLAAAGARAPPKVAQLSSAPVLHKGAPIGVSADEAAKKAKDVARLWRGF